MTDQDSPNVPTTISTGRFKKVFIFGGVMILIAAAYLLLADRLSLDYLARQESALREFQSQHPFLVYLLAFCVYVAVTGLSIPGATALTLMYAWFFGFWPAVVLVSFASTTGATLAFLLSRYLFRDSIQARFGDRLQSFNQALDREGAFYLFTLRLIPAVPFFVINVVMGLTKIQATTYWWVSQVGMLAGTCVYVYAGASIPELDQLADPSQVRAADLPRPLELARKLSADSVDTVGQRLRREMPVDSQDWLDDIAAGSEATPSQVTDLAVLLNDALTRADTSLNVDWQPLYSERMSSMPDNERVAVRKELTSINRTLLVRAFPDEVRPPQPIISKRLLVAFCLLGLFPIVAKRMIQRFRPSLAQSND